ncbi:MAG: cobalamin-dependent protein [Desulfomonilaceae bacterium]|nr:cobalamin-dependent protein [Desulfomonilaceae bacterium]
MTGRDARPTEAVQSIVESAVARASVPGKLWFQDSDSVAGTEYSSVSSPRSTMTGKMPVILKTFTDRRHMRILLVQIPTSHLGAGERVYPLGLSRLSRLIPDRFEKQALDMNLQSDPWPALKQALLDFNPDVVALSMRNMDPLAGHQTSYLSSLKTSARMVRLLVPAARILAGGPAFSLFGKRLMHECPEIDCGLIGEGEGAFPQLLGSSSLESVPGLIWRSSYGLDDNPRGDHINMDALPEMDVDLFRPADYTRGNKYVAAVGIEGKRGCDLHCAYCVYPSLGGRKMRLRSPVKIVDEMECLNKEHGLSLFHFTDSVVNRPADHFEAVCREILRRKLPIDWTGFFREDTLTEQLTDLAVRAGLCAVYFSADALTEHGLKVLNKRMSKKDVLRAARITAAIGVLTMCHFLINLPGETRAHVAEARDMLHSILDVHHPVGNLGAVIFNNVRLYPDALLTSKLLNAGLLDPRVDLLYPVYHNPIGSAHVLHELEALCHVAGVFSRLGLTTRMEDYKS